jgi:hypothetical protein
MAKYVSKNSLTGLSGKVGNMVFYVSNGIQIVRSLPESKKKRKSSDLQKVHQSSFKAKHDFARSVKHSIIDRIWSRLPLAAGMNPYNYFLQVNNDAFASTDHIEFPKRITLSKGKLLSVSNLKVSAVNHKLLLSWTSNVNSKYAGDTDRLTIAVLINKKALQLFDTSYIRSDKKAELDLSGMDTGIIEGYIFWSSPNNDAFSISDYWSSQK